MYSASFISISGDLMTLTYTHIYAKACMGSEQIRGLVMDSSPCDRDTRPGMAETIHGRQLRPPQRALEMKRAALELNTPLPLDPSFDSCPDRGGPEMVTICPLLPSLQPGPRRPGAHHHYRPHSLSPLGRMSCIVPFPTSQV